MARANLRIYRDLEPKTPVRPASTPATVTVNVGEVLPLLADAIASEQTGSAISRPTKSRSRPTCTKFCWPTSTTATGGVTPGRVGAKKDQRSNHNSG